jgi:hypothetical protein
MWARLLSSTNQPNFLRYNKFMQQLRKQNALKQALESEQHVTVANSNSAPSSPSSSTVSTHQLFPQSFFQHEGQRHRLLSLVIGQKETYKGFSP